MADFNIDDIEQELARRENSPQFSGTTGRSATNNNPLNLEYRPGSYQDKYGAEMEPVSRSGKQRFAKFPDMESGYQAGLDQIRLDQGRGHTLASFVNKFAPPHENPTGQIIQQYAKATGASPDTPLSQIPAEKLIVPMLARESSTRIVGQKENDILQAMKTPGNEARTFTPYQIASAGDQIPGPPGGVPALAEIEAELARRAQWQPNAQDIEKELAARGVTPAPTSPGGFLAPKQPVAAPDHLAKVNALGDRALGDVQNAINLPFKPLEAGTHYLGQNFLKPGMTGAFPKATPEEIDMAVNGIEGVSNLAAAPGYLKTVGKIPGWLAKGASAIGRPVLGNLSGRGGGSVDEAFRGGEAYTSALRGETAAEDIVPAVQGAYANLKGQVSSEYRTKLNQIKGLKNPDGTPIQLDLTPVQDKLKALMDDFAISVTPKGKIDFSASAIDDAAQNRIKKMINIVSNWQDKSPIGIDALKRRVGDFYSESSGARAFAQGLKNEVRDLLNSTIAQYADMTGTYSKDIGLVKDLGSNLMLRKEGMTGRITPDQTYNRLLSTTQDKYVNRKNLLQDLGNRTGEDLTGMVAGHGMSQMLPQGIMGKVAAGAMTPAAIAHVISPAYLATLGIASPRIQGELLRLIGKTYPFLADIGANVPAASKLALPFQATQLKEMIEGR